MMRVVRGSRSTVCSRKVGPPRSPRRETEIGDGGEVDPDAMAEAAVN